MSCCNNCQGYYNNCPCSRRSGSGGTTQVIVGPQGEQGPIGPQGPQGEQGPAGETTVASTALYTAATDAVAVRATPTLALTTQYPTTQTDIVLSGTNTVTLANGYYLVMYGTNATSTSNETPSIYLSLNGTPLPSSTRVGDKTAISSLSGQYFVQSTGGSTLELVFDEIENSTYTDNYLILSKLS